MVESGFYASIRSPLGGCFFWTVHVTLTLFSTSTCLAPWLCWMKHHSVGVYHLFTTPEPSEQEDLASDSTPPPSAVTGRFPLDPQLTSPWVQPTSWEVALLLKSGAHGSNLTFSFRSVGKVSWLVHFGFRELDAGLLSTRQTAKLCDGNTTRPGLERLEL